MSAESYDRTTSVNGWLHHINTHKATDVKGETFNWHEGVVVTHAGYVRVYSDATFTRLQFIHGGRMHTRVIRQRYQPRYLVTLARRFADEIAGGAS